MDRPMRFILVCFTAVAICAFCCEASSSSQAKTCILRKQLGNNDDCVNKDEEEIEDSANTVVRSRHAVTIKLFAYHKCHSNRLCRSHSAKVYKFACARGCQRRCLYSRKKSAFTCTSYRRPFDVLVYWPSSRRKLMIRRIHRSVSIKAVMPRSRLHKVFMSKLALCKQRFPKSIVVTVGIQGTKCPSERIRFPVNSVQDLTKRTLDGRLNNPKKIFNGAAGENLIRLAGNGYADKVYTLSGACTKQQIDAKTCPFPKENNGTGSNRPNPRVISNTLFRQDKTVYSKRGVSDLIVYFGQFLDHDTDLSHELPRSFVHKLPNDEEVPINVPKGDVIFDADSKGDQHIPVRRLNFDKCTGEGTNKPRRQLSVISAILDANTVYGSDEARSRALRTLKNGEMKTDNGNLPLNTFGLPNANAIARDPTKLRIAGDERCNVSPTLLSLHTLFVREHNRLARAYKKKYPTASDERIFQYARKIVIAEVQSITYREYIPALIGRELPAYKGYNPKINPGIATEFSSAVFRFGHSQINAKVLRFDKNRKASRYGHLLLREGFFRPERVTKEGGIAQIFRGAVRQPAQQIDAKVVDELRNFLFANRGNSLDLVAINLQRGRETGIPDYNTVREALGLKRVKRFSQITRNKEVAQKLKSLYRSVDNIDLWAGGLAEDHVKGSELGPTFEKIFTNQFIRIRDGDRFWYTRVLSKKEIAYVHKNTLSRIIRLNTGFRNPPKNVFFSTDACSSVTSFHCVKRMEPICYN